MQVALHGKISKVLLTLLDCVLINIGVYLAFIFRFGLNLPNMNVQPYINLIPWVSVTTILIFYMFDLYTSWKRKSLHNLLYSIILSVFLLTLITIVMTYLSRGFAFPRSVIFLSMLNQMILIVGFRSILWMLSKRLHGRKRVLIIGKDIDNGVDLAQKFLSHTKGWFEVKGFLSFYNKTEWGNFGEVDAIIISPSLKEHEKAEVMSYCSHFGIEVLVVPELYELFMVNAVAQQVDDMLVLSILPPRLSAYQRFIKRTFDLVLSSFMLVILSPIMLLLFVLIPLSSPGSALFKQERLGKDGAKYYIYKFRSMVLDAEKKTGPVLATDRDPRITRIGHFIRLTRLDELPQLLNVIKGDMSLIGPRPEREFFIRQFELDMPNYHYRMSVKPGITGLAQVLANYSTTVEDKLRFDLMYIKNYTFALDLKILFQTMIVMLQRGQAKGVDHDEVQKKQIKQLLGYVETASGEE